jgi:hypothetical protein
MNVLHLEGAKNDIRVNVLAPTARTAMTEGLLTPVAAELMTPESVTPGVLFLVSENAPSRVILGAGAGVFAVTHIGETPGVYLDESERDPETIAARFAEISDAKTAEPLKDAFSQTYKFVAAAAKAKGIKLEGGCEAMGTARYRGALGLRLLSPLSQGAQAQRVELDESGGVLVIVGDGAFLEGHEILVVK